MNSSRYILVLTTYINKINHLTFQFSLGVRENHSHITPSIQESFLVGLGNHTGCDGDKNMGQT